MRRQTLALLGAIIVLASLSGPAQAGASPASPARQASTLHVSRPGATVHVRISKISASGPYTYWTADLSACAELIFGYQCGGTWSVLTYFNFTTDSNTGQVWNNGTIHYRANGTNVTWTGFSGNGTGALTAGFNFGNGGWVREDIWVTNCDVRGPSWANVNGDMGVSSPYHVIACYYIS